MTKTRGLWVLKCSRRWLLPGTWSHLWFAGVRECPPWCSIVGATVTVHQFFCILHWRAQGGIISCIPLQRTDIEWLCNYLEFLAHLNWRLEWGIVIAHRPSVNFHNFNFLSRTSWWILMKLGRDEVLMAPFKWKLKMTQPIRSQAAILFFRSARKLET